MKLQFKHQKFQADAAKAVCDAFAGQPFHSATYLVDSGYLPEEQMKMAEVAGQASLLDSVMGYNNAPLEVAPEQVLSQIQKIQRSHQIAPSKELAGRYNLTVEMETGVGKTYTYIKTMYELNARYGFSKYIVVVPSVAIREGVYKTFQVTQEHFAQEYNKKVRFFIYNSRQLHQIDQFATDNAIHVMIINAQAFNARGKDARRIYMKLDEFRSRRPIDIIAKTNPILIIDEPQSVEGKQTKERLKEFNALFTLRYSATPREQHNLIYRLDAIEAYNKKLVKKIAVKGISQSGTTATGGYVHLASVNLSKGNPTATLCFDIKGKATIRQVSRVASPGFDLYEQSGELEQYKDRFVVGEIDGRDSSVTFLNGLKIYAGDVVGQVNEKELRRIQIRETILSHIERERQLFYRGIKVLSLFFIDEVANYRLYDEAGEAQNGSYAQMFEDEYDDVLKTIQLQINESDVGEQQYLDYLLGISTAATHAGYFSIDKNKRMVNSKVGRRETTTDDSDAYDLIMKDKERLLSFEEPVRFIFSHSALREGWDNPNVFQIATLKQSSADIRKRQEVGRGLRLCVNRSGERMDTSVLGEDVQHINLLTVIASESYKSFAKGLQTEMAEDVKDRPRKVEPALFEGKLIRDTEGLEQIIDSSLALSIFVDLVQKGYVDNKGVLTDLFFEHQKEGSIEVFEDVKDCAADVIRLIESVYDPRAFTIEDARRNNVEVKVRHDQLHSKAFKALWRKINRKSAYAVDFEEEELIKRAIAKLNKDLVVPRINVIVEKGELGTIQGKEALVEGTSMRKTGSHVHRADLSAAGSVRFDLVGKLVQQTGLTRKAVVQVLQGIKTSVFEQYHYNPEEFIIRASGLINDEKATAIIQHITYHLLEDHYETDIFTEPTLKGRLGVNAMPVEKGVYDHVLFDSNGEQKFAQALDVSQEVAVYAKLPRGFYISTPVGKYNPDWAVAFREGSVKHIYFVAETKGSLDTLQLREIESAKIECARRHFHAISSENVKYDVVTNYQDLMEKVMV